MSNRTRISAALLACLSISACGGSSTTADAEIPPTTPRLPRSTVDIPPTAPPPPESVAPTVPATTAAIVPVETVVVSPEQCPNGTWLVDPEGLGPLSVLAPSDDMELKSTGQFIVTFGDGQYTIAADDFTLQLLTGTSEIGIDLTGSTAGSLEIGADMMTFIEDSFDMVSDVTVSGEPVDGEFIDEAFHATFGSATVPYTCNDDGTLTVTYNAPTGPAPALHRPA